VGFHFNKAVGSAADSASEPTRSAFYGLFWWNVSISTDLDNSSSFWFMESKQQVLVYISSLS
jgi:hypothetical protein